MGLRIEELKNGNFDIEKPVMLYDKDNYKIFWVGSSENHIFRCNAYLIVSENGNVLIDPGGVLHFEQVKKRVSEVLGEPSRVTHIVSHHQDPDVSSSIPMWLEINPEITLITTPRAKVLLPYFGFDREKVKWLDVSPLDDTILDLGNGNGLLFLTSPFLHFPDAFVTYDIGAKVLFSSDIFAAIQPKWQLVVTDMERHKKDMMYFHVYYMASQKALKYFVDKVRPFPIKAIVPQHGSIIPEEYVNDAFEFLSTLKCGIDLLTEESPVKSVMDELFGDI